jgi:hypothetical protein
MKTPEMKLYDAASAAMALRFPIERIAGYTGVGSKFDRGY